MTRYPYLFTGASGGGAAVSCDVTALVQGWGSGALDNHGVLLRELGAGKRTLRSSEEPSVAERPRLDRCYVTP